ncbi:MAG: phosphoribosylglycinamide formyltransferase [Treponema sp.]|nr:phosphoribosylglycinamide formyltransferase [Treponema sp.]
MSDINILVLVSGNGTNLQALLDAEKNGAFDIGMNTGGKITGDDFPGDKFAASRIAVSNLAVGKIAAVVSDRSGAYALERARAVGIPVFVEKPNPRLPKPERRRDLSDRILRLCREKKIGLIVMAGFLSILAGAILEEYSDKIINIHPALLPRFGGQGMYGEAVYRAVIAARDTESGCTVHLVDAGTDTGPILLQRKVPVLPGDTPDSLAERVHGEEHIAIVEGVRMMIKRLEVS